MNAPEFRRQLRDWTLRPALLLIYFALLVGLGWCLPSRSAHAASERTDASVASEERVKAAYLFRFISYIDWPPRSFSQPNSPYVVGIAGNDRVAEELRRISSGKLVNNRPVVVRSVNFGDSLSDIHQLYIGEEENSRLAPWIKSAASLPILIVTEGRAAIGQGSMINFRIIDSYVRFEVGLDSIDKSGLTISSRMLSVAYEVFKRPLR
ncbi:MAG: YfiR family protein [Burkholderiaceae bacterium]